MILTNQIVHIYEGSLGDSISVTIEYNTGSVMFTEKFNGTWQGLRDAMFRLEAKAYSF